MVGGGGSSVCGVANRGPGVYSAVPGTIARTRVGAPVPPTMGIGATTIVYAIVDNLDAVLKGFGYTLFLFLVCAVLSREEA